MMHQNKSLEGTCRTQTSVDKEEKQECANFTKEQKRVFSFIFFKKRTGGGDVPLKQIITKEVGGGSSAFSFV